MNEQLAVTIISCEQRSYARSLTIPQFERFGLTPYVVESPCDPPGGSENARVSALAIEHALNNGLDLLFAEDDIDLHPDWFPRFLQAAWTAAKHSIVTFLYTHERPERAYSAYGDEAYKAIFVDERIKPALYRIEDRRRLFHTQAVVIPHSVIAQFDLTDLRHNKFRGGRGGAFDEWFANWLVAREDIDVMVALPNPVQHRHDRTARGGWGPNKEPISKRSRSYNLLR